MYAPQLFSFGPPGELLVYTKLHEVHDVVDNFVQSTDSEFIALQRLQVSGVAVVRGSSRAA